jgi:hypothetical protein
MRSLTRRDSLVEVQPAVAITKFTHPRCMLPRDIHLAAATSDITLFHMRQAARFCSGGVATN